MAKAKRMRICFIAHPSHTNSRSWISYFAQVLNHEVHVIGLTRKPDPIPGAVMHYVNADPNEKWRYLFVIPQVRRLVHSVNPDLLIAYRVQSYGFLASFAGFHPLVLAAQDEKIVTPPDSRLLRWCCKFAIRHGDWFNAWGPHMADHLCALGARRDSIAVRPRGVNVEVFFPPDRKKPWERQTNRPTICTTRGLYPEYRHDLLLESMALVVRDIPDALLTIVGRGPSEASIRAQIAQSGLEKNVRLCGYVEHAGVAPLLRESHVYVSVIPTEGVSSSLLEAMATGSFPIVTDLEANRLWVTEGKNGFLAPPYDVAGLAKRLKTALKDTALREKAARYNVGYIEQHLNWRHNMKAMEAEYLDLIERSRQANR